MDRTQVRAGGAMYHTKVTTPTSLHSPYTVASYKRDYSPTSCRITTAAASDQTTVSKPILRNHEAPASGDSPVGGLYVYTITGWSTASLS